MWFYNNEEFNEIPDDVCGFVYLITNLTNGKKYCGKKNFYFAKSKVVKGRRKKFKVESDWKSYYGSNKELIAQVEILGVENFRREILRLCKSKGEMSYIELREQIDRRVMERDDYYNEYILVRVAKKHLKSMVKS